MTTDTYKNDTYKVVRANDLDIHFRDVGRGRPVVLLHGGLVSASDAFRDTTVSYAPYLATLGERFRIIAPDARGAGRTRHRGGPISASMFADDVLALIAALELDHPVVAGFSEGGLTALLLGIRHPAVASGIVCDAGYDVLNPDAPAFGLLAFLLDGSDPDHVDPERFERAMAQDPGVGHLLSLMKAELIELQGEAAWPAYLRQTVARWARWPGYSYADLASVSAPTFVVVGDRDHFCSVAEAEAATRNLARGELAVVSDTGHELTQRKIDLMEAFIERLDGQTA